MKISSIRAGHTRRAVIASLGAGAGPAIAACRPGEAALNPFAGQRVIRVATFLGSDPAMLSGSDRAPIELQRAANALNAQRPGYDIRVDFMMLPPRPTAGPPGSGPTPTPFAPTALTLEAAAAGGELAAGGPPPDLALITTPGDLPARLSASATRLPRRTEPRSCQPGSR